MIGNAIKNTLQALVVYVFFLGLSSAMFILSLVKLIIAGDNNVAITAFQFAVVASTFMLSFLCYKAVTRALDTNTVLNAEAQSEGGL